MGATPCCLQFLVQLENWKYKDHLEVHIHTQLVYGSLPLLLMHGMSTQQQKQGQQAAAML